MKYTLNFNSWAMKQYDELMRNIKRFTIFIVTDKITGVMDLKTNKVGLSHCHPSEKCDRTIGAAVAYARLKGEEIPKQLTAVTIGSLKRNDEFINNIKTMEKGFVIGRDEINKNYICYAICHENNTVTCLRGQKDKLVYLIE